MLKIENFMFGSNNKDKRTSHNDKVTSKRKKASEREEKKIGKKRANKTARVKWGRGKREENGK